MTARPGPSPAPAGTAAGGSASDRAELLALRAEFPILQRTTYLISHSLGAMPRGVYDRLREYADLWASRGIRAWAEGWWTSPLETGNLVARIIGAPAGSVVMHQNVSVIEGLIASCLEFAAPRNRVVYSELNFPSVMYVWEALRPQGARIECVRGENSVGVSDERLLEAIDETTRIVPISHVCFRTSFLQDARAVCARAPARGAPSS